MKIQFETLQATIELEQSPGLASVSGVDAGVVLTALAPFYGMYGHTYEIGDYVTDYDLWAGALRKLGDPIRAGAPAR